MALVFRISKLHLRLSKSRQLRNLKAGRPGRLSFSHSIV
jgi:hypothetical protein